MNETDNKQEQPWADRSLWIRALYMLFAVIAYGLAEAVVFVVAVLQLALVLITGDANQTLLRFGNNLAAYVRALWRFVTFNTETVPFPFDDWPDEPVDPDNPWRAREAVTPTEPDAGAPPDEAAP